MSLEQDQIIELILRNRIRLTAFIRSIVSDCHSAEDIFQHVCLLALQSSEKFNDTTHLLKWTWMVCRTESLKNLHTRKNHPVIFDEHILEMIQSESEKTTFLDDPEIYSILQKCLSLLSMPVQFMLKKRYQENLTGARLAEILNRDVNSTYVAISRAHRALYQCMRKRIKAAEIS